jgi:Rps23 Pro-64 3,4-dihydroxylase Tpa1-like proline 4-hydroxylase
MGSVTQFRNNCTSIIMKRKAESQANGHNGRGILKKRAKTGMRSPSPPMPNFDKPLEAALSQEDIEKSFRDGLFAKDVLQKYSSEYAKSQPYKHGVISSLIGDTLLRSVRNEISKNVHFTPKETDIYKIHQSGDLANLDGLEDAALEKLPSLLRLRDALYSEPFRQYVAGITGSGDLSGRKTDMAINVYTPGCHLLCHDDVIGSRRVSYILYLTDPDTPWKPEWGGALRLYSTKTFEDETGEKTKTPSPDFSKVVPPAWNQLAFFAVQPGESFHDVEEVYHADTKEELAKDGGRIRMAISGWYHIPQIGEDGYVEGAEEKWGANSSLMQLQGNPDRYDFPQQQPIIVEVPSEPNEEKGLEEADLDFLLKYMAPTYLTPDTLEQVCERFLELSSVTLDGLLSKKFSDKVRAYISEQEALELSDDSTEIEGGSSWRVAKPPHKHRFLYQQSSAENPSTTTSEMNPIQEILDVFLPSRQFRRWLEIAADCHIENYDFLARRFRKGSDYALATSHEGEPRLEISLGLTPTSGWGVDSELEVDEENDEENEDQEKEDAGKLDAVKDKDEQKQKPKEVAAFDGENAPDNAEEEQDDVGGHEVYMAGDDVSAHDDAAIYKTSSDPDDDNVLFTVPANWNKLSIVLRDSGVLKFVKYVSRKAPGDRWDISGAFAVRDLDDGEDDDGAAEEDTSQENIVSLEDSEEEVFSGFPDSEDSDSD